MSKWVDYIVLIIATAVVLQGCDKIENPYEVAAAMTAAVLPDQVFVDTSAFKQRVLIEEYTGHTCGNCPGASKTGNQVREAQKETVTILNVHAGFFAATQPQSTGKFFTDFTTEHGDDYNALLAIANNPTIYFNREEKITSSEQSLWEGAIQNASQQSNAQLNLGLEVAYDSADNTARIAIQLYPFQDLSGNYKLLLLLSEDSIVDWQKNYKETGDDSYPVGDIEEYLHRHVLRDAVNGTWGEDIISPLLSRQVRAFELNYHPKNFLVIDHCTIIALVYDNDDPLKKVIQVAEVPIEMN